MIKISTLEEDELYDEIIEFVQIDEKFEVMYFIK